MIVCIKDMNIYVRCVSAVLRKVGGGTFDN